MKKLLALAILFAAAGVCMPVMASDWDTIADTFSNKNDSCPALVGIGFYKQFENAGESKLGKFAPAIKTGIKYYGSATRLTDNNTILYETDFIW